MGVLPIDDSTSAPADVYNRLKSLGEYRAIAGGLYSNRLYFGNKSLEFCRISNNLFTSIVGNPSNFAIIAAPSSDSDVLFRVEITNASSSSNIQTYSTMVYQGYLILINGNYPFTDGSFAVSGIYDIPEINDFDTVVSTIGLKRVVNNITYRDTNCTHSGPTEAIIGDTVTVNYTFPEGYGIVNPSSDVYVTNNGVLIPSTYANGTLTFTMPDPS